MAPTPDGTRIQDELVDAFEWGEEQRARALVSRLGAQPCEARAMLEQMLASTDARVRRAATFGLGELGGAASVKRLEQQLTLEEARGDYDGDSVVQVITESLGRIKDADTRRSLVRRLSRLADGKPDQTALDDLAYALWRKRHPELIPAIRGALGQLPPPATRSLRALLLLLEKSSEKLCVWVQDASVPVESKTNVLTLLDEEIPDDLLSALPSFISAALACGDLAVARSGDESNFCDRLFTTLFLHREQVLPALPAEALSGLRALALKVIASVDPGCALRAASMLKHVGHSEDAPLLEAYRPAEPALAKVFDDTARVLRNLST